MRIQHYRDSWYIQRHCILEVASGTGYSVQVCAVSSICPKDIHTRISLQRQKSRLPTSGCKFESRRICISTSKAKAFWNAWDVVVAIFARSIERTRVARRLWCASLQVVSMIKTPGFARTDFANSFAPFSRNTVRHPDFAGSDIVIRREIPGRLGIAISCCKAGRPSCPFMAGPFTARF